MKAAKPPPPAAAKPPSAPAAAKPPAPPPPGADVVQVTRDPKVAFPAFFATARRGGKTALRTLVAEHARSWLGLQHERGAQGCVMFDIDDTLIDGHERVQNGFPFMAELFHDASRYFPVHVVTARPDDDHRNVMKLLCERGLAVPPDRLHMLPSQLYYEGSGRDIELFKWGVYQRIARAHGGGIARFGDKLWDVAHVDSLDTYLEHVQDRDCYIFFDPRLNGCLSGKLPGGG